MATKHILALDVGTVRIGTAIADTMIRIPVPKGAIDVDGTEFKSIAELIVGNSIDLIVIGYPRNQSGDTTAQTEYVERFADKLDTSVEIAFQDESLTSVMAEQRIVSRGGKYTKGDIDAEAAVIILEDYLEAHV